MQETKMARELKKKLVPLRCGVHKIETGSTEIGIPDLHIRTHRHDIWIELKEIKVWPKRFSTKIKPAWRPGQIHWIREHQRRSGNAFLCMSHKDEWFLFKDAKAEYDQRELLSLSLIPLSMKMLDPEMLLYILDGNSY